MCLNITSNIAHVHMVINLILIMVVKIVDFLWTQNTKQFTETVPLKNMTIELNMKN